MTKQSKPPKGRFTWPKKPSAQRKADRNTIAKQKKLPSHIRKEMHEIFLAYERALAKDD